MIAEVVNALFLTYLATEYGGSWDSFSPPPGYNEAVADQKKIGKTRRTIAVVAVVVLVNLLDEATGFGLVTHVIIDYYFKVLHVPKVVLAAAMYAMALYWDCQSAVRRNSSNKQQQLLFKTEFLPRVTKAFFRILPVYPVAAVLISFGFLFVISLFEFLHLPMSILNWPIYYGTLYGPFSYIYYIVKRDVLQETRMPLPVAMHYSRRLGSGSQ